MKRPDCAGPGGLPPAPARFDDRLRLLAVWLLWCNVLALSVYAVWLLVVGQSLGTWAHKQALVSLAAVGGLGPGALFLGRRAWFSSPFRRVRASLAGWAAQQWIVGVAFAAVNLLRFGFTVHALNDNVLFLAYFVKALEPTRFPNDLLFQSGYLAKTAFFDVFKYPMAWMGWYWGELAAFGVSLALFYAGTWSLARAIGIHHVYGRIWLMLLVSIPTLFGGIALVERYFTPRLAGLVGLVWAIAFFVQGREVMAGLLAGASLVMHATTGLPAAGGMLASYALTLPGDLGSRVGRAGKFLLGAAAVLAPWLIVGPVLHPGVSTDFPYFATGGYWPIAVALRQSYVYVQNWPARTYGMVGVVLIVIPLTAWLLDRLRGRRRSAAEVRAWHLFGWSTAYSVVLALLIALRPLPIWILLNPIFAAKACFLAAGALMIKSFEELADGQPSWLLAAAAVGLALPLLVYKEVYPALALGLFCAILLGTNVRRRERAVPAPAAPAQRWFFASFALPVIWVGAILPLQIAKSAVERQPLIGHGFFGELNLLNSEMPLIAGKAILPYQRVQADAFSNKTRFYEYIADHSARDALVSFPEQGVFSEARVYTRLGLYYSWQDGGSAYYSSEAFAKGWLHRREVNNRFFAAESPPDQIQPAALEMWNAGVRWVIASERMDGRDQYLTLAYHDGDLWAYGFALPASP